jgi:hypothetical protein
MLVLPTLPLAEAVPPASLGETVVLVVAAAVLVLWVLRRLFKLLVFLALVLLIGTVLTGAVGVVEDSWTREAPTWTSSRPNSRSLARAMVREGVRKPPGACAHHIVAGAEPRAAPAREVLFAQRIDINDPANGVFLDCGYHRSLHTIAYHAEVNRLVLAAPPGRVRDVLRAIAANLLARTFPTGRPS